jgi:hypothetical protein
MAQVQQPKRARGPQHGSLLPTDLQRCIEECLDCHRVCLSMASQHCLVSGGEHVAPEHFRTMMACAEMCRAAAAVMMIGTEQMARVCAACAEICDACAKSCENLDGMGPCIEACRRCAEACRQMAV